MAEEAVEGRPSDLVFTIDSPTGVGFYSTRNGPAMPDRFNFAESVTPFLAPVTLADGDLLTFSAHGEVTRGNPLDGWTRIGEPRSRHGAFGMSKIWADGQIIVWGGRGDWNGAGSVDTGEAMTIDPAPAG
jgi:hypothetical protein